MDAKPDRLPDRAAVAVSWLVKRYGARVSAWEIFNEPNMPGFGWPSGWNSLQESATVYAKTLAAASSAIRQLDKKAFIISAGLSPQPNAESYARLLVRLTPPICYDGFGLHFYGQKGRFAAVKHNAATLLHEEQRPQKPLWVTEFGTGQDDERGELLVSLFEEKTHVAITFFFAERDLGHFTEKYGLRRKDGSPKRDYETFKRLLKRSALTN